MNLQEAMDQAFRLAQAYSQKKGYRLNPDAEKVKDLVKEMAENHLEFGARYCPCMTKRLTGDKKADAKRICPCTWHKEDIERFETCYCGLFVSAEYDPEKGEGIPPAECRKYD